MDEHHPYDEQPKGLYDVIVRRALDAFVDGGYSRTSTDTISRMLGISKKTLYRLFPSKQELLRSVVQLATQNIEERTNEIYEDHARPVADRLASLVSTISPIYARIRSPKLLHDFQRAAPAIWEELRLWRIGRYNALRALLVEGVQRGEIRGDIDVDHIITMYSILVDKCMDHVTLEDSSVSSLNLYQGLMEMLLRGVMIKPGLIDNGTASARECERAPLLTSALALFNQYGYTKTSSDQIAREMRISKRTLYEHFSKKSHIATTLLLQTAREVDRRCDPLRFDDAATFHTQLHELLTHYTCLLRELSPTFLDDLSVALPRVHSSFVSWQRGSLEHHLARAFASGRQLGIIRPAIEPSALIAVVRLTLENVLVRNTSARPVGERAVPDSVAFTILYDGMLQQTTQSQQQQKH